MDFDEYISHPASEEGEDPTLLIGPGGRLDEGGHLRTVADRMVDRYRGETLVDGTPFEPVAKVVGLTHDFTKLTRWAQQHLRNQPFQQSPAYRYHAFSSSLVTLYCLLKGRDDVSDYAAEISALVVAGHHNTSAPPDPVAMAETYGQTTTRVQSRYKRVEAQFDDINATVPGRANHVIRSATEGTGSWEGFRRWHTSRSDPLDGVHEHHRFFAQMGRGQPRDGYYTDVLRLWTALKFADQTAASGLEEDDLIGRLPDRRLLERHVADLDSGTGVLAELNELRGQAREDATENVASLIDSGDVGLITLPTGFGKTYAGLSAGLRAAEHCNSRLVYAIPYTSILDQTADEIQSIFGVDPYSKEFTIHHHLSDTYTGLGQHYTDADIGRAPGVLHAESWLSGLTLTTTVQLFESLAAPTARQATRIPALQESVVVIDEPQAIPERWWQIVPLLVEVLVERYDATVILMTATQPGIVKYGSDTVATRELLTNTSQYIDFLADHPRVTYRLHDSVLTKSGTAERIDHHTAGAQVAEAARTGEDVLAICNTRTSAEVLYTEAMARQPGTQVELGQVLHEYAIEHGRLPTAIQLRKQVLTAAAERETSTFAAFLSGNLRPDDRSLLISALYDDSIGSDDAPGPLLAHEIPVTLISTSLVEAGVDISFDTVFRDYAPIPNLVQAGGRCNRSFGGAAGDVIIWQLDAPDDGGGPPSLVIHGGDGGDALPLLQETGRVLRQHADDSGEISEATMVSDVVTKFYASLFEGPLDPGSERLAAAVEAASISDLEGEHMIEDIASYEDVVVCLTDDECEQLLADDTQVTDVRRYPGTQVNTDPETWSRQVTDGSATYSIIDGRTAAYHPVFGVR